MSLDMTKLTQEDFENLINVVQWAVIFSNHTHSPSCKDDSLCGMEGEKQWYCPHMGFHRELKRKYNVVAEKVGAKVAEY